MKKTVKIVVTSLCCIFVAVYLLVALCFSNVVQNIAGSIASSHFTKEWGGKVDIGGLRINPFYGVDLYGILLVHPDGDTIFRCGKMSVGFRGNPIDEEGLDLNRLTINDAYFHLISVDTGGVNLKYIIDYFNGGKPPKKSNKRFVVRCKKLYLNGVEYRMDLYKGKQQPIPEHGVCYQHQHYYDTRAYIKNIRVNESWIDCRIVRFSTREQSGFRLKDLSCDAKVSPFGIVATNMELTTDGTHLLLDASMKYDGWENMDPYCDVVSHTLTLKPGSVADLRDVGYWVPIMWGVKDKVYIEGHAEGPVADLQIDDFDVRIDDMLALHFAGSVKGLPDIENTNFDIDISNLQTSYNDAMRIALPEKVSITPPQILKPLQDIKGQIALHGTPSQCDATIALLTGVGPLKADITVHPDQHGNYRATANINSSGLKIASLWPNEWVSHTGVRAKAECHGTSYSNLVGHIDGELYSTVLRGIPIKPSTFKAALTNDKVALDLDMGDELIAMSLSASMTRDAEMPQYMADAIIDHLSLSRLRFIKSDSMIDISTHIRLNATGADIEQMSGDLTLSKTMLAIGTDTASLNNMHLSAHNTGEYSKNLALASDWLSFSARGHISYADIPKVFQNFCAQYCPAYFSPWHETVNDIGVKKANFSFDSRWKGDYRQLNTFGIGMGIAPNTTINGTYNANEGLRLVVNSDSIAFGSLSLRRVNLSSRNRGDRYAVSISTERICIGGPALLEDVRALVDAESSLSEIRIESGDHGNMKELSLKVDMQSDTTQNRLRLTHGSFIISENEWELVCGNDLRIDHTGLNLPSIVASDNEQSISAAVSIEHKVDDYVQLTFNNLSLAWLSRQWLSGSGYDIDGLMNGTATIRGFASTPYLTADLDVDQCQVNDYDLGQLTLRSDWNADEDRINLKVDTRTYRESGTFSPLTAIGSIEMEAEPVLAIDCDFDHFPLEMATPLLKSFASRFEGELLGHIRFDGTLHQPRIKGDAIVKDGLLGIAATGVTYRFSDTLHLENHQVRLHDFTVRDPQGNRLLINGAVLYEKSSNIGMNLAINSDNFMLFNISDRLDAPSGMVMVRLAGNVKGDANRMDVNISAHTNRGSQLTVPVDDRKQVAESNFITFVSPRGTLQKNVGLGANQRNTKIPLFLSIELEITPDLRLQLPMTFQQIAPNLVATGSGNVLINLAGSTQPHITGSYELSSGNLSLELFSFLATNFTIDPGSTIVLPGDINNTRFDIKASHLVHANLASLMGTTVESSGRTVNVEDVIVLSGTLNEPHVSFDLRFPNADKSVEEEVSVYIDRSNEREVLTQAISLLLTGQFVNASSNSSVMDNAASGGLNIMTSTLGNMVSNVVKVVDVNFGYQGETALTTEQFDVDIRKEWDRLYFETTLGYGGDSRTLATENATTTNLVGDVLVGYKINPRLHMFVFNRTNTNDFTRTELPYKQGVGLKLTRDFNNWNEFSLKKKKTDK